MRRFGCAAVFEHDAGKCALWSHFDRHGAVSYTHLDVYKRQAFVKGQNLRYSRKLCVRTGQNVNRAFDFRVHSFLLVFMYTDYMHEQRKKERQIISYSDDASSLPTLSRTSLTRSLTAVSYTHLDVYKRQGKNLGSLCGCLFLFVLDIVPF